MLIGASAHLISTFQAVILGLLQGVTELFPVSSLGHTVIYPHLFGWSNIVAWQHQANSPWVPFLVLLHVGSAVGLVIYFWRDWIELVGAFFTSVAKRRIETSSERLIWLIIVATIPVAILGLALQKLLEDAVAKPIDASIFLVINGLILFAAEHYRREAGAHGAREPVRPAGSQRGGAHEGAQPSARRLGTLAYREAAVIGVFESGALLAGISRDGMAMVGGLIRGLDNADAARFSFLIAAPPILLAGVVKVPDLSKPYAHGVVGPAALAAVCSAVAAVGATHFLTRFFKHGSLRPFGLYCVVFGATMIGYNA